MVNQHQTSNPSFCFINTLSKRRTVNHHEEEDSESSSRYGSLHSPYEGHHHHHLSASSSSHISPYSTIGSDTVVCEQYASSSKESCKYCKKNHRKCTRTLPSCSNCSKRGLRCFYPKPIPKKSITSPKQQIDDLEQSQSQQENRTVSIPNPILNKTSAAIPFKIQESLLFYNYLFYEVIPKQKFNDLLENIDEASYEFKAMVFALQAWREQRLGSIELSEIYFQQARLMIAPHFYNFSNIHVAMALFFLSCHAHGKRQYKEVNLYLDILNYFMDINECESTPVEMKNLVRCVHNMRCGTELVTLFDRQGPETILKQFPYFAKNLLGVDVVSLGFNALTVGKDQYFELFDTVTLYAKNIYFTNMDINDSYSMITREIIELILSITTSGYKLATLLYIDSNMIEEIWELASSITQFTKHKYFAYLPLIINAFVDLAIEQHARIAQLHEKLDVNEKVSTLVYDFELLSNLNKKYSRIDDYYLSFQSSLENTVHGVYNSLKI